MTYQDRSALGSSGTRRKAIGTGTRTEHSCVLTRIQRDPLKPERLSPVLRASQTRKREREGLRTDQREGSDSGASEAIRQSTRMTHDS